MVNASPLLITEGHIVYLAAIRDVVRAVGWGKVSEETTKERAKIERLQLQFWNQPFLLKQEFGNGQKT